MAKDNCTSWSWVWFGVGRLCIGVRYIVGFELRLTSVNRRIARSQLESCNVISSRMIDCGYWNIWCLCGDFRV